jgi:NAD(P)-dependent dehydrogenase (short-subunit alcohol dehydrogenase family)
MGGIQGSLKFPGLAAYSSSKGAVITLSELLAEEYKEQGIAFNVLALGSANRNARRSFSGLPSTYFG